MNKNEEGFTLVELMFVLIVLAVLTGVAVVSYLNLAPRAREVKSELDLKNIGTALGTYNADNGGYPVTDDFPDSLETGGYMKNVPDEDGWGISYKYISEDGSTYVLISFGIDKGDGGGDDIVFEGGIMTENGAYNN